MSELIAGENIEPGDFTYIGEDGKLYKAPEALRGSQTMRNVEAANVAAALFRGPTACKFCGHQFDQEAAGAFGCPNCHGEGLADSLAAANVEETLDRVREKAAALKKHLDGLAIETEAECAARNAPQAAAFGRGGLGSGVGDFREAADNAARVTAKAEQIIDALASGETGVQVTVGPFDLFGLTVPAIPLNFKLKK